MSARDANAESTRELPWASDPPAAGPLPASAAAASVLWTFVGQSDVTITIHVFSGSSSWLFSHSSAELPGSLVSKASILKTLKIKKKN